MTLILSGTDGLSDVDGSAATPAIRGTDANTGIFFPAADTIAFSEGGAEAMRIDSSGNVLVNTTSAGVGGLGVSAVKNINFVEDATSAYATLFRQSSSAALTLNYGYAWSNTSSAWASSIGSATARSSIAVGAGFVRFYTDASSTAAVGTDITPTLRATIDSSGNMGIGSTPNTRLQVYKAASSGFTGTSPGALLLTDSNSTLNYFTSIDFNTANGPSIPYARIGMSYTGGGSTLSFGTTNSYASGITNTAMTIDPSGNLGIGVSGPVAVLDVVQPSSSANGGRVAYFRSTASGDLSNNAVIISKFDNNTTTSQTFIKFEVNNTSTSCGKINANGANTAAFGSTSDRRVKENIVDLPPQLANIMALRPVEFDYVESYGGGHQIGFIAQDMEQIYSDVVSEDDTEQKIKSITGWAKTEARLVKAIQEQQAIITQLQADVEALKAQP